MERLLIQMLISGLVKDEVKSVFQKEVIWSEPWMNSTEQISWEKLLEYPDLTMMGHVAVEVVVVIEVDLEVVVVMIDHVAVIVHTVHHIPFRLKIFHRDVIGHN